MGGGEILIGLTWEADHHVRADRGIGDPSADAVNKIGIVFRAVRPTHGAEDSRGSALKRNMEMMRHARISGDKVDQFRNDFEGLDRAQAQTLETRNQDSA